LVSIAVKEQFQIIQRDPCLDLPSFRSVDRSFLKNKTEPFAIDMIDSANIKDTC
jgi:Ca2+-binding EF-hand superfamily protein